MTTWEIYRYPVESTRINSEFYDEFTCDKEIVDEIAQALRKAYLGKFWVYVKPKIQPVGERNWEDTGRFMQDESFKLPEDDLLWEGLKSILQTSHN